ncbi:MAG: hypothetical protein L3J26_12610 [Candidatus Polarisedimenticolaceae bacterium]|nr:hypothetical protein [Candidatus Polarisedimenticolaceae bacterium]
MKAKLEKIIAAAIRAPSGDNAQPWRLVASEAQGCIDVYNVPERDASYLNYQQSASFIAHGALIENILIAGKAVGCVIKLTTFPDANNPNHIARCEVSECAPESDPLYDPIFKRYTNRNRYRSFDLPEQQCQSLKEAAGCIKDASVSVITDSSSRKRLAWLLRTNDRMVFEHKDIHAFLFEQIRWNQKEVTESCDGMPLTSLGIDAVETRIFPIFRFWSVVNALNSVGLSRIIGLKGGLNCRSASALGIIKVDGRTPESFVAGGRALERVWLEATRQKLAFQPVVGLALLIQRLADGRLDGFSAKQKKAIEAAAQEINAIFGAGDKTVIAYFRIGISTTDPEQLTKRQNRYAALLD